MAILDNAEKTATRLAQEVKKIIGETSGIVGPWGKITWRSNKDSEKTDWKAIVDELVAGNDYDDIIKELINKHTSIKKGARVFKSAFKK
jgi:hypothetical protein